MKKFFAGLGVIALVALGTTGATHAATAGSVQPVAEIVAVPDAIIASPDAILTHSKPVVRTVAAKPVVAVPVAAPVPVAVPVTPVAVAAVPVARCEEDQPCWNCKTMGNRVCGPVASGQTTADTVPAKLSDVPLGGAWAGIGAHYCQPRKGSDACAKLPEDHAETLK